MIGCGSPNMKYDVGFYRGPDMRAEADYVVIDGVKQPTQLPELANPTCTTSGVVHVSLSFGTHTIAISTGNQNQLQSLTLILSDSGATLNGQALTKQSCNNGNSVLIEDDKDI